MKVTLKFFLCIVLAFTISAISLLSAQLFKGYTSAQLDKIKTVSKEDVKAPLIFADSSDDIVLYPWDIINSGVNLSFLEYINEIDNIKSITMGIYDDKLETSEENNLKYFSNTIKYLISCYCDNYELEDEINLKNGVFKSLNQACKYAFFKELPLVNINDKNKKCKADMVLLNNSCVYFHCNPYEDKTNEDNLSYDDKSLITKEISQNIIQLIDAEKLLEYPNYDDEESNYYDGEAAYIEKNDQELSQNPFVKFYLGTIKQETIFGSNGDLFDFSSNVLSLLSSPYSIFFKDDNEIILAFDGSFQNEYSQLYIIYNYKRQIVSGFSAKITA